MLNTSFFQYCVVYLNPETRPTPEWSATRKLAISPATLSWLL